MINLIRHLARLKSYLTSSNLTQFGANRLNPSIRKKKKRILYFTLSDLQCTYKIMYNAYTQDTCDTSKFAFEKLYTSMVFLLLDLTYS